MSYEKSQQDGRDTSRVDSGMSYDVQYFAERCLELEWIRVGNLVSGTAMPAKRPRARAARFRMLGAATSWKARQLSS